MLDSPDFEPEFYDEQNRMMMERYVVIFKFLGRHMSRMFKKGLGIENIGFGLT